MTTGTLPERLRALKCRAIGCERKTRDISGFCWQHLDMAMQTFKAAHDAAKPKKRIKAQQAKL